MAEVINLPPPKIKGKISLEECLKKRRSLRRFKNQPLSWDLISQILWAGDGITDEKRGFRSAPSGGATYPLNIYLVVPTGIYLFEGEEHSLKLKIKGDFRSSLANAALGQSFIADAGLNVVLVAVYDRITSRYGKRGIQYALQESGHIAQNIHLQAVALNLGSVPIGAFDEKEVSKVMGLTSFEIPVYIITVGYV